MPSRIWLVSELYYPEETSTGHFLTGIAEGLARSFSVSVICGQPSYAARGIRAPHYEVRNGVIVQRCWATTLNKDFIPFRLFNLITISLSVFFAALSQVRRYDHVLVVTNPPLLPFLVGLVTWLRGANCLLLIHDVYPEVLVATGIIKAESFVARLISYLVCFLYCHVQRIIVLGRDMQALVKGKLRAGCAPIVIIPNWGENDQVVPNNRSQNPILLDRGLGAKFVVQYSGNIGRTHGVEVILEAAQHLKEYDKIHFLFIGRGAKRRWLENTVQVQQLSSVTILDYVPRAELSSSLNACDIAIISFIPGMAGISVPSRMYNIMAAGKPIIAVADANSELALVIQEEQIGWVVPPGDVNFLVTAILEAHTNPARLAEMGQRARQVAETKYSFERVIESYHSLIQGLGDPLGA